MKRSPLRGVTLLFYFSPAGGGGYWRSLLVKVQLYYIKECITIAVHPVRPSCCPRPRLMAEVYNFRALL